MSKKISAARREAFFRALAETGNQTIAAERAKVSRSWVTLHRADPAFRARIAAATAAARAALLKMRAKGSTKPGAKRWGSLHEEELVVRGSRGRRVQIARARLHQWAPRIEQRFLATLAATCNVKAACAAAGMSAASAYNHRKRWPLFAAAWDAAIAEGHRNVDRALKTSALALFQPELAASEMPIPPMNVDQAIRLVRLHQRRALGFGKWPGVRRG